MEQEIIIGKYTLESLTDGMYASPIDLYREYIQNSVDSFDSAKMENLPFANDTLLKITVDDKDKRIVFFDNGCGIRESEAVSTLIDIGNSRKTRMESRGFRGIGRLAGLGYCEEIVFATSAQGENSKTIVVFDAALLKSLLLSSNERNVSVSDVMKQVVTIKREPEKPASHYFEVTLNNVAEGSNLLDLEIVNEYLIQHAPIPFAQNFKWGEAVKEKFRLLNFYIPSYGIELNGTFLYKAYEDSIVSDRVKKIEDRIKEIEVKPFYSNGKMIAILWYARTSFYGTILDNTIKGIRIRQGNILIGDKSSCNSLFKEERFNGWMIGELYVLDSELIANSRRDDFEKNDAYYTLVELFQEWAFAQSKEIRHISYERSLSREKQAVAEAETIDDINDLCTEDLSYEMEFGESDFIDESESDDVATTDYLGKLTQLLGQKKTQTRYTALNINPRLTMEQRKSLERVFDLIQEKYEHNQAEEFINYISRKY